MMLKSLPLETTQHSNAAVEEIVSTLKKETEAQAESAKREKDLRNPLPLGKTYLRILESGGHLGC